LFWYVLQPFEAFGAFEKPCFGDLHVASSVSVWGLGFRVWGLDFFGGFWLSKKTKKNRAKKIEIECEISVYWLDNDNVKNITKIDPYDGEILRDRSMVKK